MTFKHKNHSWSLVVIRGHSWSFVVTRGHSCVLLDKTFVNAEPRELPKLCLLSKASLQLTTDRLQEQNIPDSAISIGNHAMASTILD